ncbi:MAG TPA: GNAT family protein [Pyrinomonadaceae bacterium]|jgi:ribosomal-protein-serine acetyltransferase
MRSFTLDEDKIEMRLLREADAPELHRTVRANIEHLRTFLHWVTPDYSPEIAGEFIARNLKLAAERKSEGYGIFFEKKFVGTIGLVKLNWNSRSAEIGYWIAKDSEGRGIVTKACRTLIEYAHAELEMNRVEIRCALENKKSRAVPERLGFRLEGVLRQAIWRHTRFYDVAIYGLLAEEWRK